MAKDPTMKFKLVFILSFFTSYISAQEAGVNIRFKNTTNEKIKSIEFYILHQKHHVKDLLPDSTSKSLNVKESYKSFATKIISPFSKYSYIPIDHVGDPIYHSGNIIVTITSRKDNKNKRILDVKFEYLK